MVGIAAALVYDFINLDIALLEVHPYVRHEPSEAREALLE